MSFSWQNQQKPIVALAPMSGVSDIAMRSIARSWGSDLTFSEFISTDALYYKVRSYFHAKKDSFTDTELDECITDAEFWADDKSFRLAQFIESERPFIIQVFGPEPTHFYVAVYILNKLFRPDGFDINFGCPARSVVNNGAGSCLFLTPNKAIQIINEVKRAAGSLPVSIKLRASYKHVPALEFLESLGDAPYDNITIHMRSYEQVHHGEPNWDSGKLVTEFAHSHNKTCIINGGLDSGIKAKAALEHTGADGIMVAQASLGNPFIFKEIKDALNGLPHSPASTSERITTVLDHARLMTEHKGSHGMIEMRKHLLWYFRSFPGASKLRQELAKVTDIAELEAILKNNL